MENYEIMLLYIYIYSVNIFFNFELKNRLMIFRLVDFQRLTVDSIRLI